MLEHFLCNLWPDASIFQGSGSNIDICVITREGVEYLRPYDVANQKGVRQGKYKYPRGTTGRFFYFIKTGVKNY